jgi:DNA-binding HxlR family transcriptional regulator
MLIGVLKELEADGILDRKDFQEVPPHVEYSLTPFGAGLAEALRPLCDWGMRTWTTWEPPPAVRHSAAVGRPSQTFADKWTAST